MATTRRNRATTLSRVVGRRVRRRTWVATFVLTTACSASRPGIEPTPPDRTPSLPPGLSQPFALLHVKEAEALLDAVLAYGHRCAERRGFTLPPADTNDLTFGFILGPADLGERSEQEARERGLHPGPATIRSYPRPGRAALDAEGACVVEAQKRLGRGYESFDERFTNLTNEMGEAFHAAFNPQLYAADAAEARCVVKRGWKPVRPNDVGSEDVSAYEVFGVPPGHTITDRATETETYIPSPREADLALAMLRCRRDLRIPQRLLAAAKAAQLPVVGRFEQQILEINREIDAYSRRAAAVLR